MESLLRVGRSAKVAELSRPDQMIDPAVLNGSTYLVVNQGTIEDLGFAFMALTGYSKPDFCQKNISEVLHLLLGCDSNLEREPEHEYYLLKKNKEVVEVHVHVNELENGRKLYLFHQNDNFILNSELSLIHSMIKNSSMGVGMYSCPDFRLLCANQKYQDHIAEISKSSQNPLGFSLYEIYPNFGGSTEEMIMKTVFSSRKTMRRHVVRESVRGAFRYWDHTIIPVTEGDRVRFLVSTLEDVKGS